MGLSPDVLADVASLEPLRELHVSPGPAIVAALEVAQAVRPYDSVLASEWEARADQWIDDDITSALAELELCRRRVKTGP